MAGRVYGAGAPGLFLIDHKTATWHDPSYLGESVQHVRSAFPGNWVGVNCLAMRPYDAFQFASELSVNGVWADDAVGDIHRTVQRGDWVSYFGGITMKGVGYVEEPDAAAAVVLDHCDAVDVVVTSGPGTGQATTAERLRIIREAIGDRLLAVASGVNEANVSAQSRFVDYVLVASSIERVPMRGDIDVKKLGRLVELFQNDQKYSS